MAIERMEHVGVVVDDLDGAKAFFCTLGMDVLHEGTAEGGWVDRVVGLEGTRQEIVMLQTPGGDGRLELTAYRSPQTVGGDSRAPANVAGLRHVAFQVDDIDACAAALISEHGAEPVGDFATTTYDGETYKLGYLRGPAGVIVELAQRLER